MVTTSEGFCVIDVADLGFVKGMSHLMFLEGATKTSLDKNSTSTLKWYLQIGLGDIEFDMRLLHEILIVII